MKLDKQKSDSCKIIIHSEILDKYNLPSKYVFFRARTPKGNVNTIPMPFAKFLLDMTESIQHYYFIPCPMQLNKCNIKRKEIIFIIITKFGKKELLGFLWSIRPQRDIIIPYVYPESYRDLLLNPNTTPLIVTSAMLIDAEYRLEYINWNPTIVFKPVQYKKGSNIEESIMYNYH